MKKILITGANSFIGTSFEKYIKKYYPDEYQIDTLDLLDEGWKTVPFLGYDCIFHVAGMAHSDSGNISEAQANLYYAVNTDLTIETANKAKKEGARQFIYMSSAIVYGDSAPVGQRKVIKKDTPVSPANCYGDSKVQAENGILPLNGEAFKVVVLRPPMIYGTGCKGNYPLLSKLAMKMPVFPYIKNERSMLYIENLCEFVRLMVQNEEQGIFWPQNKEYTNTSEMVRDIAAVHGKHVRLIKGCTGIMKVLGKFTKLINKAFGNLVYDKSLSEYNMEYCVYESTTETIRCTEEC